MRLVITLIQHYLYYPGFEGRTRRSLGSVALGIYVCFLH
jgi:hypothetical protein